MKRKKKETGKIITKKVVKKNKPKPKLPAEEKIEDVELGKSVMRIEVDQDMVGDV